MQISVKADIDSMMRRLTDIERRQMPFAVAKALTLTARDVQDEVRKEMPEHFTLRNTWVQQGIRIKPATKSDLTALVYSRDPFMTLQETGGEKAPIGRRVFEYGNYMAIPLNARRSKRDIVRKQDWPQNLVDPFIITARDGRKYLAVHAITQGKKGPRAVSKLRGKAREKTGNKLMYTLVPRFHMDQRLGMMAAAKRLVPQRFATHVRQSLEQALATAKP